MAHSASKEATKRSKNLQKTIKTIYFRHFITY